MDGPNQEFYANAVNVTTSVYDVTLNFRLQTPLTMEEGQEPVFEVAGACTVRMSPQHAKSLAALLVRHLTDYETKHGSVLALPEDMKEMWEECVGKGN